MAKVGYIIYSFMLFLSIFVLMITGCGSGSGVEGEAPHTYGVLGNISGNVKAGVTVSLAVGDTTATTTTDSSGKFRFTGVPNGDCIVTPSLNGYAFVPGKPSVTINGADVTTVDFAALAVKRSLTLLERQTKRLLTASISSKASNQGLTWKSSDSSVATVSSTGLVTAVATGNVTVTAVTSEDKIVSTCSVSVVKPDRLIIVIKVDDLTASIGSGFARLFELCRLEDIPFSAGLIIGTLETATASQVEFLSNLDPQECELWIHGYTHYMENGKTEFCGQDKKDQIATLKRIVDACQRYLKRELSVFGAPGNEADKNTLAALDEFQSITTVFYLNALGGNRFVLPNLLQMERAPGSLYSHTDVIERAQKLPVGSVAVLQIHPFAWGPMEWREFELTTLGLKNCGAIFMTPSEYVKWANL